MPSTKRVEAILDSPATHWVGNGFPVSSVFSPQSVQLRMSPFVLLDYAGPAEFGPSQRQRGVEAHPHRGFETVTVVYQGELEHRDSAGNSGSIGPGDVQWMTAGAGLLHEEKHSRRFAEQGGVLEMAQLWVNLPAKDKRSPPRYQTLLNSAIPTVALPDGAGSVRVVAGEFQGTRGPAETFTPVLLWDVKLRKGASVQLPIPEGFAAAVLVRSGAARVGGTHAAAARQMALPALAGADLLLEATEDSEFLVLGGRPIDEPVATYGPFVMNTPQEIQQAMVDYKTGKLGQLD